MRGVFEPVFKERPIKRAQETTDNTATTVYSIPIAEEQTMSVDVWGTVRSDDGAKNGTFKTTGLFYRNASGNVTSEDQHDIYTDYTSGATADVTLEANTTTQAIDVKVTGETSVNYSWKINISYEQVSY